MSEAHWISSGEPVTLGLAAPPQGREWTIGKFTFRRAPRRGRWACQVPDRGVAGYRTPLGAFLATLRLIRHP